MPFGLEKTGQHKRQIKNTDATKTKDNPEKANDTKQNKTSLV